MQMQQPGYTFEEAPREIALTGVSVLGRRLRSIQPEVVRTLAESIRQHGLLHPIVVRPGVRGTGYDVIAGAHRLEAVKLLKHPTILARVLLGISLEEAHLVEIDENLTRAELSPAERALHIGERKRIYEDLHPETKHGGAPGKAGGGKKTKDVNLTSFGVDTAEKTGRSQRDIQRDATRFKRIPNLVDVVGTSLDTGQELSALTKLPPDEQASLIESAKRGEKVSARTRTPKPTAQSSSILTRTQFRLILDSLEHACRVRDPELKKKHEKAYAIFNNLESVLLK